MNSCVHIPNTAFDVGSTLISNIATDNVFQCKREINERVRLNMLALFFGLDEPQKNLNMYFKQESRVLMLKMKTKNNFNKIIKDSV